jgi:hypothetical protein
VSLVFIVPVVRPLARTVQRPLVCAVQRSFVVPSEDGQL